MSEKAPKLPPRQDTLRVNGEYPGRQPPTLPPRQRVERGADGQYPLFPHPSGPYTHEGKNPEEIEYPEDV